MVKKFTLSILLSLSLIFCFSFTHKIKADTGVVFNPNTFTSFGVPDTSFTINDMYLSKGTTVYYGFRGSEIINIGNNAANIVTTSDAELYNFGNYIPTIFTIRATLPSISNIMYVIYLHFNSAGANFTNTKFAVTWSHNGGTGSFTTVPCTTYYSGFLGGSFMYVFSINSDAEMVSDYSNGYLYFTAYGIEDLTTPVTFEKNYNAYKLTGSSTASNATALLLTLIYYQMVYDSNHNTSTSSNIDLTSITNLLTQLNSTSSTISSLLSTVNNNLISNNSKIDSILNYLQTAPTTDLTTVNEALEESASLLESKDSQIDSVLDNSTSSFNSSWNAIDLPSNFNFSSEVVNGVNWLKVQFDNVYTSTGSMGLILSLPVLLALLLFILGI